MSNPGIFSLPVIGCASWVIWGFPGV